MYRTLISVSVLAELLEAGARVLVFDCRHRLGDPGAGEAQYLAGHIPGALFADLERDLSVPPAVGPDGHPGRHPLVPREEWARRLGAWGVTPSHQVVAYDDLGGACAARLWWMLRAVGHEAVAVLDGGLPAWIVQGGTVEGGAVTPRPAPPYPAKPRRERSASLDEVRRRVLLGEGSMLLLDAREPGRFRGETEPIDPVAGHIPGARNAYHGDNLDSDGRFKAPEELRRRFEELAGGRPPSDLVCYCGSGVTACHNLLALEVAGLTGARLFPASWSGWCRTPGLPVE